MSQVNATAGLDGGGVRRAALYLCDEAAAAALTWALQVTTTVIAEPIAPQRPSHSK